MTDDDELIRSALFYAERDQEALLDAHQHMPNSKEAKETRAFLKKLREYRKRKFGDKV